MWMIEKISFKFLSEDYTNNCETESHAKYRLTFMHNSGKLRTAWIEYFTFPTKILFAKLMFSIANLAS